MNWFDTAAYAAEAGASGPGSMDLVLLIGFVAIFYFLLWRPQSKEPPTHEELASALTKIEDDFIGLKVAENIEFRVQKSSVGATLPKGTLKSLDEK